MVRFKVIAFAALLSACAAAGVQVTEDQLSFLKPGHTTVSEVVATLGPPTMQMRNPDGTRTISYVYSEAQTRPETFVPFVGAFVGGVDMRSNLVMLQFDGDGLLLTHTASTSALGSGMNLSSGVTPKRVEGQPKQHN